MTHPKLSFLALFLHCWLSAQTTAAQETKIKEPSFDSAGVPIHFVVTGREDGEPLVLVHGFAGNFEVQWAGLLPSLKNDYKIIGLDCRGHGGSGKPHEPEKYGLEMAHDVARLLDHLKIEKAHVAGYSMGAGICLGFAALHGDRAISVTLGGGGGPGSHWRSKLVLAVTEALEKNQDFGPLLAGLTPNGQPLPSAEHIKQGNEFMRKTNDIQAFAALARAGVGNKDLPTDDQIAQIRMPMLALVGSEDPLLANVEDLKKLRPATKVVIIDKANHMTAPGRPEFLSELRQFLNDNHTAPRQ